MRVQGVVPTGARGTSAGHGELAEGALEAGGRQYMFGDWQDIRREGADVFLEEDTLRSGVNWVVLRGGREGRGTGRGRERGRVNHTMYTPKINSPLETA